MKFSALLRGQGVVELAGYGIGDAEHRVEKELAHAAPGATLRVLETRRLDEVSRIVETFAMTYRVEIQLVVEGETEDEAGREALRKARAMLAGTRFERISWEKSRLTRTADPA